MNISTLLHILGLFLLMLAAIMLVPCVLAAFYVTPENATLVRPIGVPLSAEVIGFILALALSAAVGWLLRRRFPAKRRPLSVREGFAIVTLSWLVIALFGSLPFTLSGHIPSFVDAFFETMSGFTTTGASILPNIEALPKGLLFWRSMTQWLGGMGIIVLSLAILPALGIGGHRLFRAEVPGPTMERLRPRITETARILWEVYLLLTVAEVAALHLSGMNLYESFCHTFSTLSTGGFSPRNRGLMEYNQTLPVAQWIIILFMLLAGMNFALHYRLLHGRFSETARNPELRFYLTVVLLVSVALFGMLAAGDSGLQTLEEKVRHSLFQAISITTTTGFATQDFDTWPHGCRVLLLVGMFLGGCAGSTAGAIKMIRLLVLWKVGYRELKRILKPRAVLHVKVGGQSVDNAVVSNILGFFVLYVVLFVLGAFLLGTMGLDLESAASASAASLGNIGPGLGTVGPAADYAHVPTAGKLLLTLFMVVGRLEIFSVLVLFLPMLWKE